jgi:hypothetical protein
VSCERESCNFLKALFDITLAFFKEVVGASLLIKELGRTAFIRTIITSLIEGIFSTFFS